MRARKFILLGVLLVLMGGIVLTSTPVLAESGTVYIGGSARNAATPGTTSRTAIPAVGAGAPSVSAVGLGERSTGGVFVNPNGIGVNVNGWSFGVSTGNTVGGGGFFNFGGFGGLGGAGGGGVFNQAAGGLACAVLSIPQGSFGALVMIVSGLLAVIGAALGMYRMALSTLIVGIGSFLIFPLVSLFFGGFLPCR